jgi:dipeptidyl aminopeptidase/acylaminoacyl peptidase
MTAPRKLTYDDLWTFNDMGKVALSPDGRRVAFTVGRRDKAKDELNYNIMLLRLDEQGHAIGEPHQLTYSGKNNVNPIWAPDSRRLLFLSDREGEKRQLWLLNTDGGEARKLTSMLHGVTDAAWSPDGQWIAFTAFAFSWDDDEVLMGRKQLDEAAKKRYEEDNRFRLRPVDTVWYRLDGRGLFDRFSHLFIMPAPVNDAPADPAAVRRLTSGNFDHAQPAWTPDSQEISVLSNRADDRDRSWVSDLWTIHRETGEARCLTDGSLEISSYSWAPDGRQVMLVASRDMRNQEGTSLARLYLAPRDGGALRTLLADVDYEIAPSTAVSLGKPGPYLPQWSEDGKRAYVVITEHGRSNAHMLDITRDVATPLTTGERLVCQLALLPGEHGLLLTQTEPLHPWEMYYLPLNAAGTARFEQMTPITHLYDHLLAEFAWSEPERIVYQGMNGDDIDGWLMRPIGAREGVRYPLLVTIHGGPQHAYGVGMNLPLQYYAAQGFAVFYCNPHGSSGCGEQFMREVQGDWGGWDYQDIMCGVDKCIEMGVADPDRLVVTGYSYGGYMTMFTIGQTERFKAAAPMAGISNLASFVGTSDIGFWQVLQAKGYPWDPERAAYYRERSPLTYAPRVTTPTIFFHPENDLRCPIEQSEQFYMTLKMIGKAPVEFVRVPAAWHIGVKKPSHFFARGEKALEWFRKYVEIRPEEYA